MTLFMTSYCKNRLANDVITTDIKSAGIHFLNYHSLRPPQSFSFLDKSMGPILPFVALALFAIPSLKVGCDGGNFSAHTLEFVGQIWNSYIF